VRLVVVPPLVASVALLPASALPGVPSSSATDRRQSLPPPVQAHASVQVRGERVVSARYSNSLALHSSRFAQ